VAEEKKEVKITRIEDVRELEVAGFSVKFFLERGESNNISFYHVSLPGNFFYKSSYHKKAEELVFVLKGEARGKIGEKDTFVSEGSIIYIPPGTLHKFITKDQELVLLSVHSPPIYEDEDIYFVDEE
jgi:mannose-6-phosphate isomerase-like protein (cupin superfamily)